MKIVNAVWEERNLGRRCKEIYIEKNDEMMEVFQNLTTIEEEFQELFLPIECSEYLLQLSQYGFYYIESNFDLMKNCRKESVFPSMYAQIIKKTGSRRLDTDEIKYFMEKLRTEYFFDKDKISIDYHFSQQASANRNYWRLKDYIAAGKNMHIYEVLYEERAIGFFILETIKQGHIDVYLSGLYPECRNMNLGAYILAEETKMAVSLGAQLITTGVSLNNFSCLKVYLSLGYEIKKATNIFMKHGGEGQCCKKADVILSLK